MDDSVTRQLGIWFWISLGERGEEVYGMAIFEGVWLVFLIPAGEYSMVMKYGIFGLRGVFC